MRQAARDGGWTHVAVFPAAAFHQRRHIDQRRVWDGLQVVHGAIGLLEAVRRESGPHNEDAAQNKHDQAGQTTTAVQKRRHSRQLLRD